MKENEGRALEGRKGGVWLNKGPVKASVHTWWWWNEEVGKRVSENILKYETRCRVKDTAVDEDALAGYEMAEKVIKRAVEQIQQPGRI